MEDNHALIASLDNAGSKILITNKSILDSLNREKVCIYLEVDFFNVLLKYNLGTRRYWYKGTKK